MSRLSAIDIRKLRYVVETARFASVTRAASALFITQSALTRSIAELEAEISVQLFIRLPRGVKLTDAGRNFVERAKQIIGDFDDMLTGVADHRKLNTGRLRLGVAPSGYQRFIARSIARMAREHPNLAIEITPGSTEVLPPRLSMGDFDAIIGHEVLLRRWPDLTVRPLAKFYHSIMMRRDHPVAKKKHPSEPDILRFPLLFPSTVEPMQNNIALRCAENGITPPAPRYVCDDFDLAMAIVSNSDAYTPVISLNPSFGTLRERFLLLDEIVKLPTQRIAFAVSRTRTVSTAAKVLESIMREEMSPERTPTKDRSAETAGKKPMTGKG